MAFYFPLPKKEKKAHINEMKEGERYGAASFKRRPLIG